MYPNVTDFINHLFGTSLQFPVRTYGFFVALAFVAAYLVIRYDLKRRAGLGHFPLREEKILKTVIVKPHEIAIQFVVWAIIGFKLGYVLIDPELFNNSPEQVVMSAKGNWWTGLIAGVVAGVLRFLRYRKTKDKEEEWETQWVGPAHYMNTILMLAFIGGIGGAKIFHILENMGTFLKNPTEMLLSLDGLTFYGGLLTAGIMILVYLYRKNYNLFTMLDAFTPGLMLAYGVGRMGCQFAGDGDWGIDNLNPKPDWIPQWAWAQRYPGNVIGKQIDPETHEWITRPLENCPNPNPDFCFELINPVYPTPLYEVVMALSIFAILWFVLRKRLVIAGQLAGIYLIFNGIERFLIEKIRINTKYILFGAEITQAEIISSVLVLAGLTIFTLVTIKKWTTNPTELKPGTPPHPTDSTKKATSAAKPAPKKETGSKSGKGTKNKKKNG